MHPPHVFIGEEGPFEQSSYWQKDREVFGTSIQHNIHGHESSKKCIEKKNPPQNIEQYDLTMKPATGELLAKCQISYHSA